MERESTQSRWAINPRRALALLRITLGLLLLGAFLENYQKGLYTAETYAGYIESLITRGATPDFWKGVASFSSDFSPAWPPERRSASSARGGAPNGAARRSGKWLFP